MKRKFYPWMLIFILFSFSATKSIAQTKNQDWGGMMQSPSSNVFKARQAFDTYWSSNVEFQKFQELEKKGLAEENEAFEEPRHIFKRWFHNMAPRVYPYGEQINPSVALSAHQKFVSKNPSTAKGVSNWTFLGPTHPEGYTPNGSYQSPGGSGRVNAIAFDPTNSNVIWVGTPSGGVWKSIDGGSSWTIKNSGLEVLGVSEIVIDPTNTNIIYIGTGDRDAGDTRSVGILKSTDGGSTWNTTSVVFTESQGARCTKILMNPNNHNELLASFNGLVYKTTDGFATKSTVLSTSIWDLEYKPGDPNTVYAAGTLFYKSTDGGSTFTQVTSGVPSSNVQRMELAVSAAAPNNVWLIYGRNSTYSYDFGGLYVSTTSGASFTSVYTYSNGNLLGWDTDPSASGNTGGQSFYDLTISVNPSNASEIFVGGVNLYKSTNGGSSWTCSAYWLDGSSYAYGHADYHAIEYSSSSTLFAGNDGGIFKSADNGSTWTDISNNLAIAQVAKMGISATNPSLIMTGMQDNGTNKFNGSTWNIVYGGDGCEAICDPTNDNIVYASYVYGAIYKSTNGGSSWSSIKATTSESGAWITPYIMDPNDNNTLYAGYENVYKSTSAGSSWSKIGTTVGSGSIVELELAPSNTAYIYYIKEYWNGSALTYTVGGTTNGGSSWADLGSGLPISSAAPTSITVSNTNPQTLWITFSGYVDGEKVYKSTDAGSSWINVSNNLPNIPFNAVVYQNNSDDGIYVGGDNGIYFIDNSMSSWEDYSVNLPNVVIKELEIYYDDANPDNSRLRTATYGRSVWETPLATASSCGQPSSLAATNVTSTSAKLTWTGVTGSNSYDVRWKATTSATWITQNTTNSYVDISGLSTDDTQYEFQVRANCVDGSSAYTASSTFGSVPLVYCSSIGSTVTDEWIGRVQLASIDNTSTNSNGGYSDFTSQSTSLNKGTNYTITITPAWSGTLYNEGEAVWIDYNKDGDFDDAGELVGSVAISKNSPVIISFTVPTTASAGATRMRVSLKYNGIPTACETFSYGEVEDYTIDIADGGDTQAPAAPTNLAVSNVTSTSLSLAWTASTDNVGVTEYDVYKNGVFLASTASTSYSVTGLTASTSYSFYVKAKDAAGNVSAASSTVNATTNDAPDTQAPTAPTNLAASNITTSSLSLAWTASTDDVGVTEYDLYKNGVFLASTASTSYSVTGLTASTSYSFYVKAKDAAGNVSAASSTVNATTNDAPDTQAPTAPTNLAASNITTSSLSLAWTASTDNVGVTAYDVYKNGVFLASTASTSYSVTGLTASTSYSFYVKAKDAAGNVSVASSTVNATTLTQSITYCASIGNSVTDEWIGKVQLNTISNSSTNSNGGYSDFTAISTTLNKNVVYTITITPTWSGTLYNEGEAVWIDYNQDGDFLDAGEQVASIAISKTSPVSASFTVPASALSGATRMRVSLKYNGVPTSCETFSYGEVEDYTVFISGEDDTQAPTAPSSLAASSITSSSLNLSWTASTDNIGVTAYDVYQNGAFLASTASTSYSISGLTANTSYSFYVKAKDASGNVSAASNTVNATTLAQTISYCTANGTNTNYEYIERVVFGSIDKTSGANGGYADYTSLTTTVNAGSSYTATLYPGFASSTYNEGWAIWIDYNHDGDFDDSGELAYSHSATSATVSGSVTISSSALAGSTRMRVKMEYNATPSTSCGSFTYGEVEDYTVNIVSGGFALVNNEIINDNLKIYPNPTTSILNISIPEVGENTKMYIYSTTGQLVIEKVVESKNISIDVNDLSAGLYNVKIINGDIIYSSNFIKE